MGQGQSECLARMKPQRERRKWKGRMEKKGGKKRDREKGGEEDDRGGRWGRAETGTERKKGGGRE